jgi:TRAP-type C4-dicarboxylate transport system permease small subunit
MMPRSAYRLSALLTILYFSWVFTAFLAQKMGVIPPFKFSEVAEFLLVLTAVAALVWGLALDELRENPAQSIGAIFNENLERYAMLVAYVFVCVVIVQEVLRRYVLNFSSAWAQETAQYLFIYLGYIGAAYAVKERAHIRFDTALNRVPQKMQGYLFVLAELATLVFAIIAIYWTGHTIAQLLKFGGTTPVLRINKAWFEMAVPLGFALIVFRCIQAIARDWADIRAGRPVYAGKTMFEE